MSEVAVGVILLAIGVAWSVWEVHRHDARYRE